MDRHRPVSIGRGGRTAQSRAWSVIWTFVLVGLSCTPVGTEPPPAPAPTPEGPALEEGERDPEEGRAAARLLAEGERLLGEEDPEGALERAREVEERYPRAVGSAGALLLGARAERALERWDEAERSVGRYLDVAPADDPRRGEAALLRARIRHEGDLAEAVPALFQVPSASPARVLDEAQGLAGEMAERLGTSDLRFLVEEAPSHPAVLPPFLVELAVREHLAGNESRARELARRALGLAPLDEVAERATHVLEGRLEEVEPAAVVLGALLPESASPSLQELARQIRRGVELAAELETEREGRPVRFRAVDDHGDPRQAVRGLRDLERGGVAGVIGPVLEDLLEETLRARSEPVPVISPTARFVPEGVRGVYSLAASEPGPPRLLARVARSRGIETVVILHPRSPDMEAQAWWFQDAFHDLGGVVLRRLAYAPGTTSFEEQMREVVFLEPDGFVLFVPPEDVELVAPQIAFWGVDDLEGLRILGGEAWSSERVLEAVPPRHTEGVLTVTSRTPGGDFGPGWREFVEAYEEHFQRTLRAPTPALGYDAARLLLEATRRSDGTPEGTLRALERIRDFPGATGLLSVVDGRIQRSYLPVRIERRSLVPIAP